MVRVSGRKRFRDVAVSSLGLASLTALAIVAIAGLLAFTLVGTYREQYRSAEQHASNLAYVLAEDTRREIQSLDRSLQAAVEGWRDENVARLDDNLRRMVIFDRSASRPDAGSVIIADASGEIVLDAAASPPRRGNLADRDFFRTHAGQTDAGLLISAPLRSKLNGNWLISLSRRLDNPDRSFGGVVSAAINLSHFQDIYQRLALGRDGTTTLISETGTLIMRMPFSPNDIGRDVTGPAFSKLTNGRFSGSFEATSPIDGSARLYAFRRVGTLPLIQLVALSKQELLEAWWRKAVPIIVGFGLLSVIVASLTWIFTRELRRRTAAEQELAVMARTDSLTGLHNRRHFDEALRHEWRRAGAMQDSTGLLLIDVDCFKAYNDRYGHAAGDQVLVRIAQCLAARPGNPGDTAARYGGEEFVVVLPGATMARTVATAEAIRSMVAALALPHGASPQAVVTVSIGASSCNPTEDRSADAFFESADLALYRAKRSGRNRTASAAFGAPEAERAAFPEELPSPPLHSPHNQNVPPQGLPKQRRWRAQRTRVAAGRS